MTAVDHIITDGPPGIGCPVIFSLSRADLALLVTEPTFSGLHGLERVLGVCRHFEVKPVVCINKFDIREEGAAQIENRCLSLGVEVVAKDPL